MREMDKSERRRTLEETWASFALDGSLPDSEDLRLGRAYVSGEMTLAEILEETRARSTQPDPGPRA